MNACGIIWFRYRLQKSDGNIQKGVNMNYKIYKEKGGAHLSSSSSCSIGVLASKPNHISSIHIAIDLLARVHIEAGHEIRVKSIDLFLFSSAVHCLLIFLLIFSQNDVVGLSASLWFRDIIL